jgi:asparagine synthase (glutamine-hydrolysing)
MCGINGVLAFSSSNFSVSEDYVVRMRDTMSHRGPDGAGLWVSPDRRVGLGHRRLSIIDLSTSAAQPMSSIDGSLQLVFNGEIYNHAEIRRELEQLGHRQWKTDHSDTEVILHAFQQWGITCIERFRGMFAIGLWDITARRLWLIRDRIGIKPLYYSIHHGRLTFASEIKALLQDPEQIREVNEEAFFHYLTFATTPSPDTLFAGIRKVPPGTWLTFDADGRVQEERYWDVLDRTTPLIGASEQEICELLLAELRTSVALRTVSDVPVGIFLSGGLDSSTNAQLFTERASGRVRTFSVGYDKDYRGCQSELPYAHAFAGRIGADHFERVLTQDDFLDFLPRMIHLQDEPIADPVCMPVYYVSKLARDNGVIVAQVGEGSDELFWGYKKWRRFYDLIQWNSYPVPNFARKLALFALSPFRQSVNVGYELLSRAASGLPIFWSGFEALGQHEKLDVLSPRLRERFRNTLSWEVIRPTYERFQEKSWERTPVKWMTYADLSLRLPELLLMRVDKMGMGVSLEARVPFLDHKFVELAMSIPEKVITGNHESKHILKRAVRGLIPNDIIDRPKQGFGVPIYEWFFERFGEFAKRELSDFCNKTDFLDRNAVAKILQQGRGWHIWFLLNFALWWKEFIEERDAARTDSSARLSAFQHLSQP